MLVATLLNDSDMPGQLVLVAVYQRFVTWPSDLIKQDAKYSILVYGRYTPRLHHLFELLKTDLS